MRLINPVDLDTADFLRSIGFKRKGNVFLRIHGNGILQCIFLPNESARQKRCLNIAIRSIYEPFVFGDVSVYRGALTYPYSLYDFNIDNAFYSSDYDLLKDACIPKLDETITQESFCKLISLLDSKRFGYVRWYMEMITIPSLIYLRQYDIAAQKCDYVLSHNNNLPYVRKMKALIDDGNDNLIRLFLTEAESNNLTQYTKLKFR